VTTRRRVRVPPSFRGDDERDGRARLKADFIGGRFRPDYVETGEQI